MDSLRYVGYGWAVSCLDFMGGSFDRHRNHGLEGQLFSGKECLLHPFISEVVDKPIQDHFLYVSELIMPGQMLEGSCIVGDGLLEAWSHL